MTLMAVSFTTLQSKFEVILGIDNHIFVAVSHCGPTLGSKVERAEA